MSQSLPNFYRGKRVLVTGHTGFTGGWLVAWLKLLEAKVCGYGPPPTSRPNFFDATLLDRGISSIFADIRDREALANIFADFQPEIIFHAASQNELSGSQPDAIELFETNVMGTLNLLEEARLTECSRALVLLCDSQQELPEKQDWICSTRKIAQESAIAFAESFLGSTRAALGIASFPVLIGGGDWTESRFVGRLVHGLISGEPVLVRDTDFRCLHVLDAVAACLHLAQQLFTSGSAGPGIWDFSAHNHAISEVEFAKRFASLWSEDLQLEIRPPETQTSKSEPTVLATQQYPGWNPALSLVEAIGWTIDWCKAFIGDSSSSWYMTECQIAKHSNLSATQPATPARVGN